MVMHQAKVTQHNIKLLLTKHRPMESHLRAMRRIARNQAKERNEPETPRKAHRRAVQAAVTEMRRKLYTKKVTKQRHSRQRTSRSMKAARGRGSTQLPVPARHPPTRYHPP